MHRFAKPSVFLKLTDPLLRIKDMDRLNVDIQVVFPTLFLVYLTDDVELEVALCRAYNRWMSEACSKGGDRLRWVAIPPLRSVEETLKEIKWAKDHGIPVGPGRGSGAGSVVAWSLTITDLDPLRWGLLFERFLNPERVSMPDFDIDFCQERRDEVIGYVQERYGADRVAQIITFGTLQARAVVRDVGRVLDMPYGKVDQLANHGRDPSEPKQFFPTVTGYKFKMANVQAAIGCAQLERIDDLIAGKRRIMARYRALLGDLEGASLNAEPDGTTNGFWMPTAVFSPETGITREMLMEAFKAEAIDARVFFWPLSSLPMFDARPENNHAHDIPGRAINLPSFHDMSEDEQARVASVIRRLIGR